MRRLETIIFGLAVATVASPAFAGGAIAPAPIAGIGIGAVALIGLGYRVLKRRIRP